MTIPDTTSAEAIDQYVGNTVTFEPGARTAWHTHPLGQTLIVIAGCGRVRDDLDTVLAHRSASEGKQRRLKQQ
jgi:quercetin dioxygenase-like cupin family protein